MNLSQNDRPADQPDALAQARIALVHDWLNQVGGAENVLEEMAALLPHAPVYTSIYAPDRMPATYRRWRIQTSFMQKLPGIADHHQPYMPLYPLAFRHFDLSRYDLVLSNKSGFCHGVYTGHGAGNKIGNYANNGAGRRAIHVCYCLTPTRFLWHYDQYRAREKINTAADLLLQPALTFLRRWDYAAAQRVDHFIAISRAIQERIARFYQRDSVIIYPPVDTGYFTPDPARTPGDEYLIVSRLIPYKRIDLAVEAMRYVPDAKLTIVGDGRDRAVLEAQAGPNVTFLGRQTRARIRELMQGCKAFLFPGLEDFGIAPVEAMACGRPVIAFAGGGALDTVRPGVTGELFPEQSVDALVATLRSFDTSRYDSAACRTQAERFSQATFRTQLTDFLEEVLAAGGR